MRALQSSLPMQLFQSGTYGFQNDALERHLPIVVSTKWKTILSDKDTPKEQLTICLNEPFEHGILENVNPDNGGEIPRIGQSIECFTAEELEQGSFWGRGEKNRVKISRKIFTKMSSIEREPHCSNANA